MTIHWVGTGLSAVWGLRQLLKNGKPVAVWNRTVEKAREAVGDLTDDIRAFTPEALEEAVADNDIVVSMLPADLHISLAEMCLRKNAHFICSSYISPEMLALDNAAAEKGLHFVNEVGLDPGIDHLMAHDLVDRLKMSAAAGEDQVTVHFTSLCGGFPAEPNDFRYKFSWSPLGVLKALQSPSKSIRDGEAFTVNRPWDALDRFESPLDGETFETYPNRDSLPFVTEYEFDRRWHVGTFVRGTLRQEGWADAWADVFREIDGLEGPEGEARLKQMSDELWQAHAYGEGEADRVVLFVSLRAGKDGQTLFHQSWAMDAVGNAECSAMGRLVSGTVALAVRAVETADVPTGVTSAPKSIALVEQWLDELHHMARVFQRIDHLG